MPSGSDSSAEQSISPLLRVTCCVQNVSNIYTRATIEMNLDRYAKDAVPNE